MTDAEARWRHVEAICQEALDRTTAERPEFLRESCGDDAELRRRVEHLLAQESAAASFLDDPVSGVAAELLALATAPSFTGQRVNGLEVGPLLGSGGMGEVYRAHDSRLGRDVALKVLPAAFSADPDRLRRFEREARAVAALSHPNVVVIHDVGSYNGTPYVVTELLEGQDLRHRLASGPIPSARAIELAVEIALGLAAAHARGIIHRDIKPENLFITTGGHIKILDFGLAKITSPGSGGAASPHAAPKEESTQTGVVLGTASYMSPEQIRGDAVDQRSDIFSLGLVLYEMLSGQRAFARSSPIETMAAILNDEVLALLPSNPSVSPQLVRLVNHCLRKQPTDRFHSAQDLALALDTLTIDTTHAAGIEQPAGRQTPGFRKLTFRRGNILHARFTPDGQSVVYSAAWDGKPCELYMTRVDGRESRRLGIPNADILSISASGELAILLKSNHLTTTGPGTLARVPIGGGSPREIHDDVLFADWGPNGELAAMIAHAQDCRVEYPPGTLLHRDADLGDLRVSQDGAAVAVVGRGLAGNDSILVLDGGGTARTVLQGVGPFRTIGWSPQTNEILFTHKPSPYETALSAARLEGSVREIHRFDGSVFLCDVSRNGQLLLRRETHRCETQCFGAGYDSERDLSWLDGSVAAALSEDGRMMLFSERGWGVRCGVYLRNTDGSEPVWLGEGWACDLSPDGRWVLTHDLHDPPRMWLIPTKAGRSRLVSIGGLHPNGGGFITNDLIHFDAAASDGRQRPYVVRSDGSELRLITDDPVVYGSWVSPDGNCMALVRADGQTLLYPLDGGEPRPVEGMRREEVPVQWSVDGRFLYVRRFDDLPVDVHRVEIATGKRELWRSLMPLDATGVIGVTEISVARNGRYYAYTCARIVSAELFVADGLI